MGIDLGATRSVLAVSRNREIQVIPFDNSSPGDLWTESVVSFDEEEPIIGKAAVRRLRTKPDYVIFDAKLLCSLHHRNTELKQLQWPFKFKFKFDENRQLCLDLMTSSGLRELTMAEINAIFLKQIKKVASEYQDEFNNKKAMKKAVITVPKYFWKDNQDPMISSIVSAAELASIEVIDIIEEAHADLLYYLSNEKYSKMIKPGMKIGMVDIGGGTFISRVYEISQHQNKKYATCIRELFTANDNEVAWSGRDIDDVIIEELGKSVPEGLRDNLILRILEAAKKIKHDLSYDERTEYDLADIDTRLEGMVGFTRECAFDEKKEDPFSGKRIPDFFPSTGNNTPHCPPEWTLESKINSCLMMPKFYYSWDDAANYCENVTGGELISIYNQMEYDTVRSYGISYSPSYPLWIGLYNRKDVSFNSYKWMDGGYFNFSQWLPGEPMDPKVNCFAFKTLDSENGYKGMSCKYQQPFICRQHSIACPSEVYNGTSGIISSSNYPDNYDNQLDCFYHIIVPQGYIVNLTILDFETETLDYLNIYDGPNNNSFLIFNLKGYSVQAGTSFESTQNEMTLWFHSDYSVAYRGWKLNFTASTPNPANWYNASSGTITSPNYPDNYTSNLYINYKIVTPPNTYVKINVTDFITESPYDYLRIMEGLELNINNTIAFLYGNYTGTVPMTYHARSNMVLMVFYTDHSVVRKGFSLDFQGMPLAG